MMKKLFFRTFMVGIFWTTLCFAQNDTAQVNKEFAKGDIQAIKNAIDYYKRALKENPASYEAAWKCTKALREYANEHKLKILSNWKSVCTKYGKEAMSYGKKAQNLNPNGVEGFYWYGLAVGTYSDGVSILRALKEGLKNKTQSSFEKAYQLDKNYQSGGPILSLGRFWSVLPWPLKDKKQAEKYFKEYEKLGYFKTSPFRYEARVFYAELLIDMGQKGDKTVKMLNEALSVKNRFFRDYAQRLLKKVQ